MKDERLNKIISILLDGLHPEKIILFGSRSKANFSPCSDYDIAVETNEIDFRRKRKIKDEIEKIMGLHKIDIIYLNEVEKRFGEIILKTGKTIYVR